MKSYLLWPQATCVCKDEARSAELGAGAPGQFKLALAVAFLLPRTHPASSIRSSCCTCVYACVHVCVPSRNNALRAIQITCHRTCDASAWCCVHPVANFRALRKVHTPLRQLVRKARVFVRNCKTPNQFISACIARAVHIACILLPVCNPDAQHVRRMQTPPWSQREPPRMEMCSC